jgi:hypothetical protein
VSRAEAYFRRFTSVEASNSEVRKMCRNAIAWERSGLALVVRYVELVADPGEVLARIRAHLSPKVVDEATIGRILREEVAGRAPGVNQFNAGKLSRFRKEMRPEEIELCNAQLGK